MISAMQAFDSPTVLNQIRRQVVEQLRVRRLAALGAEVVRVGGQSRAEVILPDAVDDGARGQAVVGMGDPASERQSSAIDFGADEVGIAGRRITG